MAHFYHTGSSYWTYLPNLPCLRVKIRFSPEGKIINDNVGRFLEERILLRLQVGLRGHHPPARGTLKVIQGDRVILADAVLHRVLFVHPGTELQLTILYSEGKIRKVGLARALRVDGDDVNELARKLEESHLTEDELLLHGVVKDQVRGPVLGEGKVDGVQTVIGF